MLALKQLSSLRSYLVLVMCVVGMLGYFLWSSHRHTVQETAIATHNLTEVIASRIDSDFKRIDGLLAHVARGMNGEFPAERDPRGTADGAQRLASLIEGFDVVAGLYVFDADGNLRLASQETPPFNVADRPHFRQVRDTPALRSFSEAQVARATGRWSLVQVRAIRAPDGRFLGAVSAVIHVDAFARRFAGIEVGPGAVVLLRRSDDFKLIQRVPPLNVKDFNQPLPPDNDIRRRIEGGERSGTLDYVASTDGVRRLGSFKRLDDYPFYVQVALSADHYLAGWRGEALYSAVLVLLMLAGSAAALLKLARSERHTIELDARLRDETARQRSLLDAISNAGIMLFVVDGDYRVRYMNAPMRAAFGDAVGKICYKDVGGSANPCPYCELHHVIDGGKTVRYAPTLPDGRHFDIVAQPYVDADGSPCKLEIIRDVTEQERVQRQIAENEQRLANILWGTGVGTWEWNAQTGETRFNERWAELIGYTLAELAPVDIETWMRHAHPDDLAASAAALERHFSGAADAYECTVRMRHKDGRWVWLFDRGRVVSRSADGQPLWMAGTHFDISALKQAETELRERTQALERSNAELEQFSYSISHDMRQPLRMVSSYLQLIEMKLGATLDAEGREFFHFAVDGAKRMDAMLLGLLEYSRVGRKGEPPGWLESRAALDDALLFLQPARSEAGAAIRVEGDWPRLFASRDELLRLLQNLIGNALKFRIEGRPPEIRIVGERSAGEEGNRWRCCVADNGVGILPDQAGRLFQVFQRLQSRVRFEGTGIGLALCRKIVEHHGGRIWAESAGENLGSRFCFEIPLPNEAPVEENS